MQRPLSEVSSEATAGLSALLALEMGLVVWFRSFVIDDTYTDSVKDRDRDRGFMREDLPLPTEPPFTAHIGNLSFDATSTDVSDLFADCEVTNVRIVEDKLNHAPKGFGYVEFATVDGLKKALTYSGTNLQGRGIRVSVAEPRTFHLRQASAFD
jgi:hypothetical protein